MALADRHGKSIQELLDTYPLSDIYEFIAHDRLTNDKQFRVDMQYELMTPEEQSAFIERQLPREWR